MGVELASMGVIASRDGEDEESCSSPEPKRAPTRNSIIRDGRLAGGILLGDIGKAAYLMQAFDRNRRCPTSALSLLFDIGEPAPSRSPSTKCRGRRQICNCNGVSKGAIVRVRREAANAALKAVMDATRAGMGCGSCKTTGQRHCRVGLRRPGRRRSLGALLRARRPADQTGADSRRFASAILQSVSAVFDALAGGKEDAGSKPGLASLLKTLWGAEYEDERDARFINDRVHANIQKDGTFSRRPAHLRRRHQRRRSCGASPMWPSKYHVPMVKLTGGQRIDLLGIEKERPAAGLARPRHAVAGTRTRKASAPARPASARISAATAWATARRSASQSRSSFQGSTVPAR